MYRARRVLILYIHIPTPYLHNKKKVSECVENKTICVENVVLLYMYIFQHPIYTTKECQNMQRTRRSIGNRYIHSWRRSDCKNIWISRCNDFLVSSKALLTEHLSDDTKVMLEMKARISHDLNDCLYLCVCKCVCMNIYMCVFNESSNIARPERLYIFVCMYLCVCMNIHMCIF